MDGIVTPLFSRWMSQHDLGYHDLRVDQWQMRNTLVGSITVNMGVLTSPSLGDLRAAIQQCLDWIWRQQWGAHSEIYITESWINLLEPGQHHHPHHHPNSILSGVYWPWDSHSQLVLMNDRRPALSPDADTAWTSSDCHIPTQAGQLTVFDSQIDHYVTASDRPRWSLAFNTWARGEISRRPSQSLAL